MSSVGGASNGAVLFVKEAATLQVVNVAVIKKGLDVERANGEAALRLIESAKAVEYRIDEYV